MNHDVNVNSFFYINQNQNAMNYVTSIYLVRDMHKTVTIFLCMNLKKSYCFVHFAEKERKKDLFLVAPWDFRWRFNPIPKGASQAAIALPTPVFFCRTVGNYDMSLFFIVGPMIRLIMGRQTTQGQCCQSRTKSTSELLFSLEFANSWFT